MNITTSVVIDSNYDNLMWFTLSATRRHAPPFPSPSNAPENLFELPSVNFGQDGVISWTLAVPRLLNNDENNCSFCVKENVNANRANKPIWIPDPAM